MKDNFGILNEEDVSRIRTAIANKSSVEFSCYTLTPQQKDRFLNILTLFLDECNQPQLFNCLSYCLLELLDNASKANAKRIYFQKNNLNINNSADYENGMKNFKSNLNDHAADYIDELNQSFLQVMLHLSSEDNISLTVTNNTKITEKEYERILSKIDLTSKYETIADALSDVDSTEGCGLGIVSIVLMLKTLGLSKENLKFKISDNITEATIEIPVDVYGELDDLDDLEEMEEL